MTMIAAPAWALTASEACMVDTTPPAFAGLSSATALENGGVKVVYPAPTGTPAPLRVALFIGLGTLSAAELFVSANRFVEIPEQVGKDREFTFFQLADRESYLTKGQVYTFGARALDAVGNEDANTVVLTATSEGVVPDSVANLLGDLKVALTFSSCDVVGVIDNEDDEVVGALDEC